MQPAPAFPHSLRHPRGRTLARSSSLDPPTLSFLLTRESPPPGLSRQVLGWSETSPPSQPTLLCRPRRCSRRSAAVAKLIRRLHRHDWIVYAQSAFGGPLQVFRYLGRYTHRVAISNHRLLAFDQERVTFRWKDYAHGGKQGKMTLGAMEFLRRFFFHVLPKGFARIRHFGFLTNRFRASRLALCRQLLVYSSSAPAEAETGTIATASSSLWHCPRCGASMIVRQRFTAAELSTCTYFNSS